MFPVFEVHLHQRCVSLIGDLQKGVAQARAVVSSIGEAGGGDHRAGARAPHQQEATFGRCLKKSGFV